ncbi:MAG TPA: phosphatidate cytidylyltransferase [Armatimonadota bacterium]
MKTRILTALVGIPLILVLLYWPGGWAWTAGVAVVTAGAMWEFTAAMRERGAWVHWIILGLYGAALLLQATPLASPSLGNGTIAPVAAIVNFLIAYQPDYGAFGPLLAILAVLAGDLAWSRRSPLRNVGATLIGVCWIGALFPFLARLRFSAPPSGRLPGDAGAWWVLAVLLVIWFGDSGAYFIGRAWGRHKCAPGISPNKTWEGVLGGLAASAAAGAIVGVVLAGRPGAGAAFGILVGAAGQVGDLVESAIKRELGIKDFGAVLPGHGGVLDRFDSLLFAAPVGWALLKFALGGR